MDMPFFTPPPHTEICHFNIVTFSKYPVTSHGGISILFLETHISYNKRVSMGLTDRRKTAKNLVDSRKN